MMDQIQQIGASVIQTKEEQRDIIGLIRRRVHLLSGRDRLMMKMYLDSRITFGQLGRLLGVDAANVGRRIHRVTEKLVRGEYIECLRRRQRFTPEELSIARNHFLLGASIREIANQRNESYYQVQQTVIKIKNEITCDKCGINER